MENINNNCDAVIQNLEDAGCHSDCIERFIELDERENVDAQLKLLNQERVKILDCVHESQRRLDCLDYLVYQLKKKKKSNSKSQGGRIR